MKITMTKNMRIDGRMYRTGDAAPVSRAHARVLIATGRAKEFVAKPVVAAKTQVATPPAAATQEQHVEHAADAAAPPRIHHDFHQPSPSRHAEAGKAGAKTSTAAKKPAGPKIEK